ncbi:MAG: hypothetical protein MI976_27385 [Pseudomonadales bacterium]|nr:hypothetical protein [Pseudomonadales bacterium]
MNITNKLLLLVLTVVGLAACKQANIVAPTNGAVAPDKPTTFEITYDAGIPADLAIQLNTADVTDVFTITDTGATATGAALADFVYSGRNFFRLTAYNKTSQVIFHYDTTGPTIHITDADKTGATVSGYLVDVGGIASLTLDGAPVAINEDNSFTTSYTNMAFNQFVATDNFGHENTVDYARGDNVFNGLTARLNQGGFDFLVRVLEEELSETDFKDIITGIDPIDFLGLRITITDFDYDDLNIDLDVLDNERIHAGLDNDNFVFGINIRGTIPIINSWLNVNGTMSIDELLISTDLLLDIVDSDLDVSLSNTTLNHTDPYFNLFSSAETFFDDIVSGMINIFLPLFENLFIGALEQIIVPIVSDFIKDIPITLQLVTLDDGETLNIRALPSFLDSKDNGVTVDLGTRIWAPEPPAGIPGAIGSLYQPGETPTIGNTTPDGEAFHFGAGISSNVINQALFAAHEAGVTTMAISPGFYPNATPEGISVYAAESVGISDADQLGMRIEPVSPPFVKFMEPSSGDGAAGVLGWYDASFAFDLYKPEWGEYRTLFGATFDLEVPFHIDATEDGFLSITIEQLPTIKITKTDNTGMILIPPSFINNTLDYFMPAVMPRLAQKLKAVPLPRIYRHTLFMNDFWISGSQGNNLVLAGSLIPISTTEAASAPDTAIESVATANIVRNVDSIDESGTVSSDAVEVVNGEVTIDIDGLNPNPELGLLQYRYRVDGGGWSAWRYRDEIHLTRLLAGTHQVEVCSRTPLLKREVSCPVVEFDTSVTH